MGRSKNDKNSAKSAADEEGYTYSKYIVRDGKKIYPKNAKVFRIPVSSLKKA